MNITWWVRKPICANGCTFTTIPDSSPATPIPEAPRLSYHMFATVVLRRRASKLNLQEPRSLWVKFSESKALTLESLG